MPMRVGQDRGIAVVAFDGDHELADARDAIDEALGLVSGGARGLLLDFSASQTLSSRSPHQIRLMALYLGLHRGRFASRAAVVAPSDAAFGLMRLGSVTAEDYGIMTTVTRDYSSALSWLETGSAVSDS